MIKRSAAMLLAVLATGAGAEVVVRTEQIFVPPPNRLEAPVPLWEFGEVPRPSKSDIAEGARVTVTSNRLEAAGADASVLVNGRLPNNPLDLTEGVLLSNDNGDDGCLVLDLGSVQPVAAVCTYSWHEWDVDQGSRAPQLYTLSGSADGETWTRLADVDTRPNQTGQKWNGQHGVYITDKSGALGAFRYLSFAVRRTRSPLQPNAGLTGTLFHEIDVHTRDTLAKAGDAAVAKPVQVTDVWVAFKTHCDIGYTDTIEEVLRKFRVSMMDTALRNIEADRALPPEQRFAWMLAGWPLKHVLGPRQDPARKALIEQAVREGAIGIGAIPFSLHTETEDLEDLVRGLGFASQIARQYGRPLPIAAKMTDVPCHSWAWPTVLSHAGVQFLQLGCNGNSGYLRVPHLFWWEGPDGSRVLCNFTENYGSGIVPPKGWPARNYLAMIMTGDNHGPPTQAEVANLRKAAEQQLPGVRVHLGTLDDFARAVAAEKPDLPVIRGDMPDTWIHGWMSMPVEAKLVRDARPFQPALDVLDTQLRTWGLQTGNLAPALAEAYEQSNLYSEHTFGPARPDMGSWNSGTPRDLYGDEWRAAYSNGAYKAYEKVFDDKRAFARREAEIVERELKSRLDLLARSVKAAGRRVVVFNGLPWARSGAVEVPGEPGRVLWAEDVPACGYRTFPADLTDRPDRSDEGDTLDSAFFKAKFDRARGGITSLIEKKTGRELVDRTSPYALGQFLHERFDAKRMREWHMKYARPPGGQPMAFIKHTTPPDLVGAELTPPSWQLAVRHTDAADVVTLTAADTLGLARGIDLVFTFNRRQPLVDVEWRVTEKTPDPIPEGGWLCFPFAVEQPVFTLGRLGGPIDPAKDIVPGANRDLICLNSGLTIAGKDSAGIGLCPVDSPCVSLGEPGLWKYTLADTPRKPAVFVNLYNNEWHTNFPEWQGGSWSSRVRLWPTADHARIGTSLVVPSWEARLPLVAAVAEGPAGELPPSQAGLTVSRPGVLVTAFGQNPDGPGTLLRVWEQGGVADELTVTLPGAFKTATPVNLRGENSGEPLKIGQGKLAFNLRAYAPASFVLE
jgi:alpha-mannosidase